MSRASTQSIVILIVLLVLSVVFYGINEMKKQDVEKENVMLGEEIKSAKQKIKVGEDEIERLNNEIENQITKASNEKEELRKEIERGNSKVNELSSDLNNVTDDRDKWKSRVDSIKDERDNLMATIKSHKNEVDKLSSEIVSLKKDKKELLRKLAEKPEPQIIYKEREPEPSRIDQPSFEGSGGRESSSTGQTAPVINITPASSQNEEYWAGILREKIELEVKVDTLEKKLSDESIQIVDIKQKNESLKIKIEMLEKDKEAIERGIVKKEAQLQELIDEKEKGIQKLIVENAKERAAKDEVINNLSIQLAKSKNENSAIEQTASKLEKESQELRKQMEKLVSTKGAIEKSLLKLTQDKKEVEKQLDQSDGLIQSKINEIWSVKESIDKVLDVASPKKAPSEKNEVELAPIIVSARGETAHSYANEKVEEKAAKFLEGKIVSINEANNFVIIDLGESSGIETGDAFNIFHDDKYIGKVEVIQVRKDISAADIKDKIAKIKIGDIVK